MGGREGGGEKKKEKRDKKEYEKTAKRTSHVSQLGAEIYAILLFPLVIALLALRSPLPSLCREMICSLNEDQRKNFRLSAFYLSGPVWKELEIEAAKMTDDKYASVAEERGW